MAKVRQLLPQITREGQFIAFVYEEITTAEGQAYCVFGCDGFSRHVFNGGAYPNESEEAVAGGLLFLLTSNDIQPFIKQPFTVVFDRFEEHQTILSIVCKQFGGSALFHPELHHHIAEDLIADFRANFLMSIPQGAERRKQRRLATFRKSGKKWNYWIEPRKI